MKRDLDVIRLVLQLVEEHGHGQDNGSLLLMEHIGDLDREVFEYHFRLCLTGGLVDGEMQGQFVVFRMLTSKGHDYLDLMRSETVWNAAKENIKSVGSWSLQLLGDVLKAQAKEELKKLGLPI